MYKDSMLYMSDSSARQRNVAIAENGVCNGVCKFAIWNFQETSDVEDTMGKTKQQDNPFIEPSQQHTVVDMKGETAN